MHIDMKTLLGWGLAGLVSVAAVMAEGEARLADAVKSNDAAAVRALLSQKVDVNAPLLDGSTALHWAVHRDDLATVDLLIRAGAKVNVATDLGATPLHLACTNRAGAMVDRLLKAGANPNASLERGTTVLMECARTGDLAAVKALLAKGANVNAKEPLHSQTALMWAAAEQHSDVVEALIELGADVKARSRTYSQVVVGEETQRAGREELNYTVYRGGSSPLLFAARSGDAEAAKLLLAAGADANDALPNGASVLTVAAHSGHGKLAALLLDKGADPNNGVIGYTALHAAVLRSDLDLVNTLLAHGAKPDLLVTKGTPIRRNTTDYNIPDTVVGATPYFLAAKFLEPGILTVLAAAGADTQATLPDGTTPLIAASGKGTGVIANNGSGKDRRAVAMIDGGRPEPEPLVLETVTAVLGQPGTDINAVDNDGNTALHSAASIGVTSVVQFLADKGAQLNVKNKKGQTALGALLGGGKDGAYAPTEDPRKKAMIELLRKLGATE